MGKLPGECHIVIDDHVRPVQHLPRRVAAAAREPLRVKLNELEQKGVITEVTEPTDWISSLVTVMKPGKMRLCIDPKELNEAIKRPRYPMTTIEDIMSSLSKAKVFSKLDAKDGYWHILLDEESSRLTTFWTPYGRYRWRCTPFGLSSAPEEFQRRMNEAILGLKGVTSIADDVLIYGCGETVEEAQRDHDENLIALLDKSRKVGLQWNSKKIRILRARSFVRRT